MEKPYVPFYKPYGMTDEEYEYEVRQAEQRVAEWEAEQEQIKISSNTGLCDSLQQDSEMLFHECSNCNIRCNCSDQRCSCCNIA